MEQWKAIKLKDVKGIYEVSSYGRVRSVSREVIRKDGVLCHIESKVLKMGISDKGYQKVQLCHYSKMKGNHRVHRLVGFAFIDNPFNYPEINHKNGDKLNNHYKNLEWVTRRMNIRHAIDTGLLDPYTKSTTKVVYKLTKEGLVLDRYGSIEEAAMETGCKVKKISDVVNGCRKMTGGYGFVLI